MCSTLGIVIRDAPLAERTEGVAATEIEQQIQPYRQLGILVYLAPCEQQVKVRNHCHSHKASRMGV